MHLDWPAESIQSVVFTQPTGIEFGAAEAWRMIFGDSYPDTLQRVPIAPGLPTLAVGVQEGFRITVNAQSGRIDLILTSSEPATIESPAYIADVASAASVAAKLTKRIIPAVTVNRLAVLIAVGTMTPEMPPADLISQRTGVPFHKDSLDCIYQYNVRGRLPCSMDTEINRIATWSSQQRGFLMANLPMLNFPVPSHLFEFVSFKADVNTIGNAIIDSNMGPVMLDEISDEAVRMVARQGVA